MYRWRRTSRNHRDSCILCQGRVHSIQLGHLQLYWTPYRVHIQAGHPVIHSVELPISREADDEIEMCLWGGLLLHSLGHIEPSLWTLFSSWTLLPTSHSGYPLMTQTFVDFLNIFRSLSCSDWQISITTSLWWQIGRGRSLVQQLPLFSVF